MPGEANLFTTVWDFDREGTRAAWLGRRAGAELLGASVYELEPEARWADLHFHHANEEMLFVVSGTPTLITGDDERVLEPGEVVALPRGKPGTHRVENRSEENTRFLITSTNVFPDVVEYPERASVFVLTEPPYTEGTPEGEERGRLLRVFNTPQGRPVPPDG